MAPILFQKEWEYAGKTASLHQIGTANEPVCAMLTKNQIKFVKSLQQKKYRNRSGMFVAEGVKTVRELLKSRYKTEKVYTTAAEFFEMDAWPVEEVSASDLERMSGLKSPGKALGVFQIPPPGQIDYSDWVMAVDSVGDPGNLGTIIRLCDWFGFRHLVCSAHTVDCYNPKVLQATMGSIARVAVGYTELVPFLEKAPIPVYGGFMDGKSVYGTPMPKAGILVVGSEGNGISESVAAAVTEKISVPRFGGRSTESLNVAMATAILLNEIRRG